MTLEGFSSFHKWIFVLLIRFHILGLSWYISDYNVKSCEQVDSQSMIGKSECLSFSLVPECFVQLII